MGLLVCDLITQNNAVIHMKREVLRQDSRQTLVKILYRNFFDISTKRYINVSLILGCIGIIEHRKAHVVVEPQTYQLVSIFLIFTLPYTLLRYYQ